ncbi:VOC family protein [Streptomyces galilaeus]
MNSTVPISPATPHRADRCLQCHRTRPSGLLGWHLGHEEPGTAIVAASPQRPFFVFQQAWGYRPPVWLPVEGEQRPMMHFDFQVGDLDSAVAEAVALGATVAEFQPQENVRVSLG